LSPEAAAQSCAFLDFSQFGIGKCDKNKVVFIYATVLQVLNSHEKVLPPALTVTIVLILPPIKRCHLIKTIFAQWHGNFTKIQN